MKNLRIAAGLSLPLEAVTQAIGILAKRRAGKSYTMRRLAEQLLKAGQQVVIVDPKGDQWGIRSASDGVSPGLPVVILGGERADVPLEVHSGEVVAKLVVEDRVSVLLDLSLFRKGEVATFMASFLENLYRLKSREVYRTPMMLIIDEADAIAPQKPFKGEERMLGAAEDIVRRGGQRGIGCTLVTQRSAVLNKNVLTQVQLLVVLRTIAPQDLAAIDAWIDVHGTDEERKLLKASLPSLPIGDAWFWSPGWPTSEGIFERVHVLPIETFDSAATPKPGEKRVEPKNLADVDLNVLKKQMAATIEKAKAQDPRELNKIISGLKKEITELKKNAASREQDTKRIQELTEQLQAERAKVKPAGKAEVKEKKIILAGDLTRLEAFALKLDAHNEGSKDLVSNITALLHKLKLTVSEAKELNAQQLGELSVYQRFAQQERTAPQVERSTPSAPVIRPRETTGARSIAGTNGELPGVQQKVLDALAELEALGMSEPPVEQVAFMAGYSNIASKSFANARGALRSSGMLDYPTAGAMQLTNAGRAHAATVEAPISVEELQSRIINLLGGTIAKVVKESIKVYPDVLPVAELARRCGYENIASKSFANARGRARTLGLITYPTSGQIKAASILFME